MFLCESGRPGFDKPFGLLLVSLPSEIDAAWSATVSPAPHTTRLLLGC